MKKIAIIGGGISGLTAAFYIQKFSIETGKEVQVTIYEKDNRLGGKIRTLKKDGFVIERGPDSFLKRKKEALELVEDLHLSERVISNQTGKSYILKGEELHPIPEGSVMGVPTRIKPLLDSGLLSMDGKARALNDLFIPPLPPFNDISVGDFFKARLGEEMVDHVISPLLSGIYAGNIYKLSMQIALPNFIEVERRVGSLMLGLKSNAPKKATTGQFATLNSGLESLVAELVESFQEGVVKIQTGVGAAKITKSGQSYVIMSDKGDVADFDSVVLSVPHQVTENLLPEADYLKRPDADPNTSVATIAIAFSKEDVHMSKEGTGFVVSRREPKSITAATWTHMKWGHAAPNGKALIRCYVGKAGDDQIIGKSDEELVTTALKDMSGTVEIKGEPDFAIVSRWPNAMPQYPVGHKQWFDDVNARLAKDYPGVHLAGASYDGVGIPDCIRQGKTVATRIMK